MGYRQVGKAHDFDSCIRRFESFYPSQSYCGYNDGNSTLYRLKRVLRYKIKCLWVASSNHKPSWRVRRSRKLVKHGADAISGRNSVWLECVIWDHDAAGSSPVVPTNKRGRGGMADVADLDSVVARRAGSSPVARTTTYAGVLKWLKSAVLKIARRLIAARGFESYLPRHLHILNFGYQNKNLKVSEIFGIIYIQNEKGKKQMGWFKNIKDKLSWKRETEEEYDMMLTDEGGRLLDYLADPDAGVEYRIEAFEDTIKDLEEKTGLPREEVKAYLIALLSFLKSEQDDAE